MNPYDINGESLIEVERGIQQLEKNRFWEYYIESLKYYLQDAYERAGKSYNKEDREVRVIQGEVKAWELINNLPDNLIRDIQKKLGKPE